MSVYQYRATARRSLKGKWSLAIGIIVMLYAVDALAGLIPADYAWISLIAVLLIIAPLSVGVVWFFLDVERKSAATMKASAVIDVFKQNYLRNLSAILLITLFTCLWSLLLIVPGIIQAHAYSMTFFILRDQPELSAYQAIQESKRMMAGKKKDLFVLALSTLGWVLIPAVVSAVGFALFFYGLAAATSSMLLIGSVLAIVGLIAAPIMNIYFSSYFLTSMAAFYDEYANK